MKKLTYLLILLFAVAVSSCGSGYDEKTCEDLIEKYDDKGKLNDQDLAEAIKQLNAILDEYDSQLSDIMHDLESSDESTQEKAIEAYCELYTSDMSKQCGKLIVCLENSELKGDNKKAYKEHQRAAKKKSREFDKVEKKVKRVAKKIEFDIDWNEMFREAYDYAYPYEETVVEEAYPAEEVVIEDVPAVEEAVEYTDYYAK